MGAAGSAVAPVRARATSTAAPMQAARNTEAPKYLGMALRASRGEVAEGPRSMITNMKLVPQRAWKVVDLRAFSTVSSSPFS